MATLLSLYNTYKFWFDVDNFQKQSLKRAKNTPAFPHVKSYAVQKIKNKRAWMTEGRVMGTIMSIIMIILTGFLITALFIGQ